VGKKLNVGDNAASILRLQNGQSDAATADSGDNTGAKAYLQTCAIGADWRVRAMKQTIRKAVVLLLALCMAVSLVPMSASVAVSGQNAYYLARLKPNPMPKAQESYPAKLLVKVNIPNMMNIDLEFKCTVGVNAELADEKSWRY
jgi:hypothetical protein